MLSELKSDGATVMRNSSAGAAGAAAGAVARSPAARRAGAAQRGGWLATRVRAKRAYLLPAREERRISPSFHMADASVLASRMQVCPRCMHLSPGLARRPRGHGRRGRRESVIIMENSAEPCMPESRRPGEHTPRPGLGRSHAAPARLAGRRRRHEKFNNALD